MLTSRDKGPYAYSYAKPSKRMSQVLAVDRELLLRASTFMNQQQRTIKTARGLIAASDGRLESAIAIIVPNDPDGDLKMQN